MIAHEHKVQVGVRTADKAQILEGVEPGAKIVVAGGLGLEDGARVRLQEAADNNEKKDDDKEKK